MSEETTHPNTTNVVTEQDKGRCAPALGSVITTEDAETLHEVLKTWDALSQYEPAAGQEGAYQYGSDHRHDLRDRLSTLAQKLALIATPPNDQAHT